MSLILAQRKSFQQFSSYYVRQARIKQYRVTTSKLNGLEYFLGFQSLFSGERKDPMKMVYHIVFVVI